VKDRFFLQFFVLAKTLGAFRSALGKIDMHIPSAVRLHIDINPISTYF